MLKNYLETAKIYHNLATVPKKSIKQLLIPCQQKYMYEEFSELLGIILF